MQRHPSERGLTSSIFHLTSSIFHLPSSIHKRSPALPGVEALVGTDFVNHTHQNLPAPNQGNGHSIGCKAVDEVRRTVQRVDHPSTSLLILQTSHIIPLRRPLFGDEPRLGQQSTQRLDYELFRTLVHIRHIVVGMLALHLLHGEARAFLFNISPSLAGYITHLKGYRFKIQHICRFFEYHLQR